MDAARHRLDGSRRDTGTAAPPQLADEHSLDNAFPDMTDRADRCRGEYEDARDAWTRLLEPYEL